MTAPPTGSPRSTTGTFGRRSACPTGVELEPRHQWAWNNLGRVYLRLGMLDSAITDFKRTDRINPYDQVRVQ